MKYNPNHGRDGRFAGGGGHAAGGGAEGGGSAGGAHGGGGGSGGGATTQEQLFAENTSWAHDESNGIRYDSIYTAQSHIESHIVNSKIESGDFNVQVARINDDGHMVNVLVDGNHSLQAAIITNTPPIIHVVNHEGGARNLEEYVSSFGDLSNPVNVVTGRDLW